jgi:hypothetical protein
MKPISFAGIVLLVLGVVALVYQGINYTRQKNVIDVGSVHITRQDEERIPLPPIVGGVALAAGAVLLFMGARNRA